MTMNPTKVTVVLGTRPEIIKLAPVVHAFERRVGREAVSVIDTGQHYDASMSQCFWEEFGLREPDKRLRSGGMTRSASIGYLVGEIGEALARSRPDAVIVQGDTNSTVAGSIAANAVGVPLVHVEAGLRSFDRNMPEEHNRIVSDHLADLCCAATPDNVRNLIVEGIKRERILRTGNTIVEAVRSQLPDGRDQSAVRSTYRVDPASYVLATIHRPENTDNPVALGAILDGLARVGRDRGIRVLLPLHPRTRAAIGRAGLEHLLAGLQTIDPIGSSAFLSLATTAAAIVSDSGGVAEEVTILKRPLIVVRRSTERGEAVRAGFARLVRPDEIYDATTRVLSDTALDARLAATPCPYGDGTAAEQIVEATVKRFGSAPAADGSRTAAA